jgi:hypothetical protein
MPSGASPRSSRLGCKRAKVGARNHPSPQVRLAQIGVAGIGNDPMRDELVYLTIPRLSSSSKPCKGLGIRQIAPILFEVSDQVFR